MRCTPHAQTHTTHRLKPTELRRELKRLGLKFGALPGALRPQLLELFQGHSDAAAARAGERAALNAVADAIAQQLPGGWSAKQVGTTRAVCARGCVGTPAGLLTRVADAPVESTPNTTTHTGRSRSCCRRRAWLAAAGAAGGAREVSERWLHNVNYSNQAGARWWMCQDCKRWGLLSLWMSCCLFHR
jgi:hypothetical protein